MCFLHPNSGLSPEKGYIGGKRIAAINPDVCMKGMMILKENDFLTTFAIDGKLRE